MTEGKKYKINPLPGGPEKHNRYGAKMGEMYSQTNRYNAKSRDQPGRGS